ncbi:MAG: hypothetical protein ABUK01_14520 [Leptospirales bacterium]
MKKYLLYPVVFLLTMTIAPSCLSNLKKKPKVTVESFEITEMSFKSILFEFDVVIDNPFSIGIKLGGVDISVFVEKARILKTTTKDGFTIGAKAKRKNRFVARVEFAKIYQTVQNYRKKDYLDGEFHIDISIPLSKDGKNPLVIPIRLQKEIPVIRPKFRIANFKIHPPTFKEFMKIVVKNLKNPPNAIKLKKEYDLVFKKGKWSKSKIIRKLNLRLKTSFDLLVINETPNKMKISELNYNFKLAGSPFLKGKSGKPHDDGEAIVLPIESMLKINDLTTAQLKAIENRKGDYEIQATGKIMLPASISKKPVKLNIKEKGSFKL